MDQEYLDKEIESTLLFQPIKEDSAGEKREAFKPIPPTCLPRSPSVPTSPNFNSPSPTNNSGSPSPSRPTKECYTRILDTLKRIEDEEKVYICASHGIPKNGESAHQVPEKPVVLSRPSTPNLFHNNNSHNHNNNSNSLYNSPRQLSHFTVASSSAAGSISSFGGGHDSPRLPQSTASTPRLPPLSEGFRSHEVKQSEVQNYNELLISARSIIIEEPVRLSSKIVEYGRASSISCASPRGDTKDNKVRNILTFLDEVETSDRQTLYNLKCENIPIKSNGDVLYSSSPRSSSFPNQTIDALVRKGSVDLAREVLLLERKIEEYTHNIRVLEDTLINQRELNMRHIKNSERDMKKRLKLQQEEYELVLSRNQAFVDQLISEKRLLQEKCEKLLRDLKETEMKNQDQLKSLQQKHLEELQRLRRIQDSSEKARRVKWMGTKTQQIRETTIKNLEPDLQRVISRHQQEMTEMRAWHANEIHEMEERSSRKLIKQAQEIREQMLHEKEEALRRDRELISRRHASELEHLHEELESQKKRYLQELHEERERNELEQQKIKELIQENIRKVEIKAEVELEALKDQYEAKILTLDRKHDTELKTVTSIHEAERESYVASYNKKLEQTLAEKELAVAQELKAEREAEMEEREKKLRADVEKQLKDQEEGYESRLKRLQTKLQDEIQEFEKAEKELKSKMSLLKAETIAKDEEVYGLKAAISLKEKQVKELSETNMKMLEERANLTAVIRREFDTQIDGLAQECSAVKSSVVELNSKHKLEREQHALELERVRNEKDNELDRVGERVIQAMARKDETICELHNQLEKSVLRIQHLEDLLEQQRKEFVQSMTVNNKGSKSVKLK